MQKKSSYNHARASAYPYEVAAGRQQCVGSLRNHVSLAKYPTKTGLFLKRDPDAERVYSFQPPYIGLNQSNRFKQAHTHVFECAYLHAQGPIFQILGLYKAKHSTTHTSTYAHSRALIPVTCAISSYALEHKITTPPLPPPPPTPHKHKHVRAVE